MQSTLSWGGVGYFMNLLIFICKRLTIQVFTIENTLKFKTMKPPNPQKQKTEKYEYIFDFQRKIIIQKLHGEVRIKDIVEMLQNVFYDENFNDTYNVLVDVCNSTPIFQPLEMRKVMDFLIRNKEYMQKNKIAFVTSKPRHVVDSYISHELAISMGLNIKFKAFSTYEEAYSWLGL